MSARAVPPRLLTAARPVLAAATLPLLATVTAFNGILCELMLAQSLSATMGDTLLRYNTTIGAYIAAMGVGALLCRPRPGRDRMLLFAAVEVVMAVLGAAAPVAVLVFDWQLRAWRPGGDLAPLLAYAFNYGLVAAIGMISGFELPLLMGLGEVRRLGHGTTVLAADYGGMLLGAVAFPLLFLPTFGLFTVAVLIGAANVAVALCALAMTRVPARRWLALGGLTLLAAFLALAAAGDHLQALIVERLYMRG